MQEMIKDHIQKQVGGDNSTNLQAKNITVNQGLSYANARDIALDIYNSNFIKLSEAAANMASERAISFSEKFLTELYENNTNAAAAFETPALQSALYNAQKEYAKSGEQYLADTLCNLLIERAKDDERGLKQLAIEEAINIAPKLTSKQLDILSLNYLAQDGYYYINSSVGLEGFIRWILPFKVELEFSSPEISHLEFTGCAKIPSQSYGNQFPHNILESYPGVFTKGFSVDEYKEAFGSDDKYMRLITGSEEDANNVRFKFRTIEGLKDYSGDIEYTKEERIKIVNFLKKGRFNANELKDRFMSLYPESEAFFDSYINDVYRLQASPVGTAIALSNIKRKIGLILPWPYRMRSA